jgi:hypothetical protein
MNTVTRGDRGRKAVLTASILAVVAVGLAGCQTGVVDRTENQAQQLSRSNAASQARYEGLAEHYARFNDTSRATDASQTRYEGLAEYWQQRAQQAEPKSAITQVPVVADRLEQAAEQHRAATQVPVVADRLEQARELEGTQVPIVADRLEQAIEREAATKVPVVADRLEQALETHE